MQKGRLRETGAAFFCAVGDEGSRRMEGVMLRQNVDFGARSGRESPPF